MKTKQISAQEYNDLPRSAKRKMRRGLEAEGFEMPEIRERVKVIASADKEIYLKALPILDKNGINLNRFLDLALQNLILADK